MALSTNIQKADAPALSGVLPSVPFLRNPLDVLGFNRLPFVGKSPEEADKLIKIVYRFWARIIHPDSLNQHPLNPVNGGDPVKWKAYLKKLPNWLEIDKAYQDLQDPNVCAAAIKDFKPITPALELTRARAVLESTRSRTMLAPTAMARFLTERFDSSILTIANCGPANFYMKDLGALLDEYPEGDLKGEDLIANKVGGIRSFKELKVNASGRIEGRPESKLAFVFSIEIGNEGLAPLVKSLRSAGLRIPTASFSLPSSNLTGEATISGAVAQPRFGTYRLDTIQEKELVNFIPFISARISASSPNQINLLVSLRESMHGQAYAIEGIILKFDKILPTSEMPIKGRRR